MKLGNVVSNHSGARAVQTSTSVECVDGGATKKPPLGRIKREADKAEVKAAWKAAAAFYGPSNWEATKALAQDLSLLALCITVGLKMDHWAADVVVWLCVGCLQFALGESLLHDASHYNLFTSDRTWVHYACQVFYAWPFFITLDQYRDFHNFIHHQSLMKGEDTATYMKLGLMAENPNMFYIWFIQPFTGFWHYMEISGWMENLQERKTAIQVGCFYTALFSLCFFVGGVDGIWALVKYWCVPLVAIYPLIGMWSEIEEHYNTVSGARSQLNPIVNFFFHNEGYHWIHHRYPKIPFFRNKMAHEALAPPGTDISYGFFDTYRQMRTPKAPEELWASHPTKNPGDIRDTAPPPRTEMYQLEGEIPSSVELKLTKEKGWGLFATRAFKQGDAICENTAWILPTHTAPVEYTVRPEGKPKAEPQVIKFTHKWTEARPGFVYFSGYDSATNHACEGSNTFSKIIRETKTECVYEIVATADIAAGQELTCNYNVIEYQTNESFECSCGSTKCVGTVVGFGKLPQEFQRDWWEEALPVVQEIHKSSQGLGKLTPTWGYYAISDSIVKGLAGYQYSSAPYVWIDRKLSPFWQWAATFLPTWMHPNLVTTTGFVPCLLFFLHFLMRTSAEISAASFVATAFLVFCYQTLDCLDGIQARKLKLSSPLGQLFDHGLDAIVLTFGLTFLAGALGLDSHVQPALVAAVYYGGMANFFCTVWRERHTGGPLKDVMYFGEVGVTSSEFFIMATLLVAGLHPAGASAFGAVLFDSPTLKVTIAHMVCFVLVALDAVSVGKSLFVALTSEQKGYPYNIWGEFSSFFVFMVGAVVFVYSGAWAHLNLCVLASGAVSAMLVQNCILYDMADLACDRFYMISLCYLGAAVLYAFTGRVEVLVLNALVCVAMETIWVVVMFPALAKHLKISIFSTSKKM